VTSEGAPARPYTLVAFHAHPDDEALYTGGTLAAAAAAGHRVVVVVATAGERGLSAAEPGERLGGIRLAELDASAAALGVARVVCLGYGDSGFQEPAEPAAGSFCAVPAVDSAVRLAELLTEEAADVLTVYDANGGYGHRDHRRVREVGLLAAATAGTPVVLEATIAREALQRGVRLLNRLGIRPGGVRADQLSRAYRSRAEITHEIDVRRHLRAKRAALRAHASQAAGGADVRTVALLSRLPWPLSRSVLGREWFVEVGRQPARRALGDVFATVPKR
jgi:LmbE family N-acetylglucosaminyl deacetylase